VGASTAAVRESARNGNSARDGDDCAPKAAANVAPVSNRRFINFEDNEFPPEYTTVCGPK
jgi:hypothetical protein